MNRKADIYGKEEHHAELRKAYAASYPVLRRRYTQMRDMRILSSLWKSRVELSRGTKNDETKRESRF